MLDTYLCQTNLPFFKKQQHNNTDIQEALQIEQKQHIKHMLITERRLPVHPKSLRNKQKITHTYIQIDR